METPLDADASIQDVIHPATTSTTSAAASIPIPGPAPPYFPTFPIPSIHATSESWHFAPCGRPFLNREQTRHLNSSAHREYQLVWDSAETMERSRQAAALALAASRSSASRVSAPPIQAVWECTVCQRTMTAASMDSHLGGGRHAKRLLLWEASQAAGEKMEVEKMEEEQQAIIQKMENEEMERVRMEHLRTQGEEGEAARALIRENAAAPEERLRLAQERVRKK